MTATTLQTKENCHSLVSLPAIAGTTELAGWGSITDQGFADVIFHLFLGALVNTIVSGWPTAKSQIEEVIADSPSPHYPDCSA